MRVYLDNCCYNRPFDDQGQLRVRLETEAKLEIQSQMRAGILEYVWSDILSSECLNNREPRDYTQWRNANLFVGESVRETAERAKRDAVRFRKLREAMMPEERAAYA